MNRMEHVARASLFPVSDETPEKGVSWQTHQSACWTPHMDASRESGAHPALSLCPLSVWLPRECGGVASGKFLNTCDPNFPICKRGIITVLWVSMTDTWPVPVTGAATVGTWQGVPGSSSPSLSPSSSVHS